MKKYRIGFLAIIGMIGFSSLSQAGLSDGLIAYYPFNGNTNDESGNGNHGVINGANLTQNRFGEPNNAYSFDGINDYILVNNSDTFPKNAITVSYWVNRKNMAPVSLENYISKELSFQSYLTSNSLFQSGVWRGTPGVWTGHNSTQSINNIDEWIFYVWTFENSSRASTYYINGVFESSNVENTSDAQLRISSHPMYIGRNGSANVYYINSDLDDIRIYNRALSESEIQELYNEGSAPNEEEPETPVAILSENLDIHIPVLHYQINESATTNLDVYLSSAPSENGNLTWQLESYSSNVCSNTQNSCLSEFEVATAFSSETNSQTPFNIHIPAINSNANTYWANLGFIGSRNGNLAWQLQDYGVSDKNIVIDSDSQKTTSTSIFESNPQLVTNTLLFGINVAATFTEQNLPELIQLSRNISIAKEAYWLVRSTLPDPNLVTLPSNPSQAINNAFDAMSEMDDQIFKATQEIEAGKVVDGLGDTNLSRTFSRIATGLQVITSAYSTYDILEKTLNGNATTADKENYIINGTFSIFGLTQIISTPAVANGVVMKGAGFIGLGYAALQLGAAWGEHVNGITVTGTIEDSVNATLSQVENLDALARIIASGASVGRTWEEMKALESIQTIKNVTINAGVTSIEALETPSAIASIISTGNTFYADSAKELILDTMNLVNSEQYSVDMYQKIYKAGRQAFFANRALEMLNEK